MNPSAWFPTAPRRLSLLALVTLTAFPSSGQFYRKGDVIEPFTLNQRGSSERIQLEDFAGKILFIEWFAWWCPFCQAAAPQVEQGIARHYTERSGNPDGIPVVHLAVNLQAGQETQTQNFVTRAGFGLVAEDFNRALANRFQSGGQPIFAIINGVTNSPSHKPWELLLHQNGYGTTQSPIETFRAAIDAVRAAPGVTPPRIDSQPASDRIVEGTPARFEIGVSGSMPLTFQWAKNGLDIPGATAATLTLPKAQRADAGVYTVRISNSAGSILSEPAILSVIGVATAPPVLNLKRFAPNGESLLLQILSPVDSLLRVQRSMDLTRWEDVSVFVNTTPEHTLELPFSPEAPNTFWRVLSP